jgi:MFS family permease
MDHAGAMTGPLLASGLLVVTDDLRVVFAAAAIPAALAVAALVFGVHEERRPSPPAAADRGAATGAPLEGPLLRYLAVLAVFTLGNSSDAFLLLRARDAGIALWAVPLVWAFHNLVKAAGSTWGGTLSDRLGRRRAILAGWAVYALSYLGFAVVRTEAQLVAVFGLYGLFSALAEGPERALVADLSGETSRGRAFGLFHAVTGAALLPASLLTGVLWQRLGAGVALGTGAALALLASILMLAVVPETRRGGTRPRSAG